MASNCKFATQQKSHVVQFLSTNTNDRAKPVVPIIRFSPGQRAARSAQSIKLNVKVCLLSHRCQHTKLVARAQRPTAQQRRNGSVDWLAWNAASY